MTSTNSKTPKARIKASSKSKDDKQKAEAKRKELLIDLCKKLAHGLFDDLDKRHCMTSTPEFQAYCDARNRCENPSCKDYPAYGNRGIRFKFESFRQFWNELGPRPAGAYSIDRIDNDSDYAPGNVRWATPTQQAQNRRKPSRKAA